MFESSKLIVNRRLSMLCLLLSGGTALAQSPAVDQQRSPILAKASSASQESKTLSGTIVMKWRTGGVSHQTRGTIQLAKPNLGRIDLQGDFPEVALVSDGRTRYLASAEDKYQQAPIDAKGAGLDSPWWGLPFRFFFTQGVNPFGGAADPSAVYSDIGALGAPGVLVKGNSPMGGYTEKLFFNSTGDLIKSSVQFGEGPGSAIFQATLTDVRHERIPDAVFRFTPKTGQSATTSNDGMLPLGSVAPAFTLRTAEGKRISLQQQLRGKKAMLVNFWYYNCAPCRIEFPQFESLYKQFASQGLGMIAINKGDSPAVVSRYVGTAGLTFPVVLGGEVGKGTIFERYKVTEVFPGTYLLNRDGKVVYRTTGADVDGIKRALSELGIR